MTASILHPKINADGRSTVAPVQLHQHQQQQWQASQPIQGDAAGNAARFIPAQQPTQSLNASQPSTNAFGSAPQDNTPQLAPSGVRTEPRPVNAVHTLQPKEEPGSEGAQTPRSHSDLGPGSTPTATRMMGPMSGDIVLPARKKPGRKPKDDGSVDDKRRLQNRQSQRKFRENRKNHEEQIQLEFSLLIKTKNDEIAKVAQQRDEAQQQRDQVQKERDEAKNEIQRLREEIQRLTRQNQHRTGRGYRITPPRTIRNDSVTSPDVDMTGTNLLQQPGAYGPKYASEKLQAAAPLTPPDYNAYETDFTNVGPAGSSLAMNSHPSRNTLGPSELSDTSCGFCTDDKNCVCRQGSDPVPEVEGPGNCDACLADPQRAQACRQLAASAQAHSPYLGRRMTCEQFMDRAQTIGTLPSIAELVGDQITAHRTPSGRYEVEEHEAAQALQTLYTRNGELERAKR